MNWIDANSSNIERFAYDPLSRVLKVAFRNGGTYDYFDVSPADFQRMCSAPSKGQFLASDIKGKYRYARA